MKFVVNLTLGIRGKSDDPQLWFRHLSSRKNKRDCQKATKILVIAGGHGAEVDALVKIHGPKITKKIWFNDLLVCFTNAIAAKYPDINIVKGNFLTMEFSMKFDIVLGNPPFIKGTWIKFIKKAVNLATQRVLMISPDGTNTFSSRSDSFETFLKDNGIQSKTDCTKSFPGVDSGKIVLYDLDLTKTANPDALIDYSVSGKILTKIVSKSKNKLSAILSSKRSKDATSAIRYDSPGKDRVLHIDSVTKDGVKYVWIDKKHTTVINADEYWITNRYFGKDATSPVFEETGNISIGYNVLAIKRIPGWTAEEFKIIYLSPILRFALNILRQGAHDTSPRHLAQLPVIPKSKKSVESVKKHFELDELEFNKIKDEV